MNKLERCRETRLWLKQVVIPLAGIAVIYMSSQGKKLNLTERFLKRHAERKIEDIF